MIPITRPALAASKTLRVVRARKIDRNKVKKSGSPAPEAALNSAISKTKQSVLASKKELEIVDMPKCCWSCCTDVTCQQVTRCSVNFGVNRHKH